MNLEPLRAEIEKLYDTDDIVLVALMTDEVGPVSVNLGGDVRGFKTRKKAKRYIKQLKKEYKGYQFVVTEYKVRPKVP